MLLKVVFIFTPENSTFVAYGYIHDNSYDLHASELKG